MKPAVRHGPKGSRDGSLRVLHEIGGVTVLFLGGEADITTAAQLSVACTTGCSLAEDGLVVDVSALAFLDVAGLRELIRAHRWLLERGRAGVAVRGASGAVRRIFELTGCTSLLGDSPAATQRNSASPRGASGQDLETGRQHAGLSLRDLFVAYFALGGTADFAEVTAHLSGSAAVLDLHQRDVAAHALNERLAGLGRTEYLLSYAAD
jgi:anti-anti-sigma factor